MKKTTPTEPPIKINLWAKPLEDTWFDKLINKIFK